MLKELLVFELRYHFRQGTFRLSLIAFLILGFLLSLATFGTFEAHQNAPVKIAFGLALLSLGAPIMLALLAGGAILRDQESRMEPIIFSTSLTHFHYVTSRFFGLVIAGAIAMTPAAFGLALGHSLTFLQSEPLGPFQPFAYLWAWGLFIVPNILFSSAIIFATASLTKSSAATYISGVFLYILYFVGSMLGNSPLLASSSMVASDQILASSILDPYGLVALLDQVRYWSAAEKNLLYPGLTGSLLLNRLFCSGMALVIFATTYRLFQFRQGKAKRIAKGETAAVLPVAARVQVQTVTPQINVWQAYLSQTRIDFRTMVLGLPFYAFLLLWFFFIGMDLFERKDMLGLAVRPFTPLLLEPILDPLIKFGVLAMVFYTSELLWNERRTGIDSLIDVCPVPNGVFWAGKITALAGMIATFLLLTFALVIGFAFFRGQFLVQWHFFLTIGFQIGLLHLLSSVLAMALMCLIPHKYASLAVAFFIIIGFTGLVLSRSPFLSHPMLRFGSLMPFTMSAMADVTYHAKANLLFLGYWSAIASLLALFTLKLWKRGLNMREKGTSPAMLLVTGCSFVALVIFAALLFHKLHVKQHYFTPKSRLDWQETYEKTYGGYASVPQPTLIQVDATALLFPKQRSMTLEAKLVFQNQTEHPISEVLLGVSREVQEYTCSLDQTILLEDDREFHHQRYRFDPPMLPGQQRLLNFAGEIERSGFQALNPENYILPGGSYVEIEKLIPFFGYSEDWAIANPKDRQRRGLAPAKGFPAASEAASQPKDWVTFALKVVVPANLTVVAPGDLIDIRENNGLRTFQFRSDQPVPLGLGIAAAPYIQKTLESGNTRLTYHYLPTQPYHADAILQTAATTLRDGQKRFGPYPFTQFKLAALPSFSNKVGGTAYSGTVYLVEDRVILLEQRENDTDIVGRVVAHETGHQWWGRLLNPAPVAGMAMLTEMLAVYTEQIITLPKEGIAESYAYLDKTRDLYFFMRTYEQDWERSLSEVHFQPYIYYFKGAHATYALIDLLGQDLIDEVLRELLNDFTYPAQPVARDLLDRLYAKAPLETHPMIHEWLEEVVTYQMRLISVSARELTPESANLSLAIHAYRNRHEQGVASENLPLGRVIEVGLLFQGKMLSTQKIYLSEIHSSITLQVDHAVDEVVLDPRNLLLAPSPEEHRQRINPLLKSSN